MVSCSFIDWLFLSVRISFSNCGVNEFTRLNGARRGRRYAPQLCSGRPPDYAKESRPGGLALSFAFFKFGLAGGLAWAIGLALRAFLTSETPFLVCGRDRDPTRVLWIGKSTSTPHRRKREMPSPNHPRATTQGTRPKKLGLMLRESPGKLGKALWTWGLLQKSQRLNI